MGTKRTETDASLRAERAKADSALDAERIGCQLALAELLAVARRETDSRLRLERACADESLATHDDVVASMRHDLRTLSSIIAISAATLSQMHVGPPVTRGCAPIKRALAQMAHLVSALLEVACSTPAKSPSSEAAMMPPRSSTRIPRLLRRRHRRTSALFLLASRTGR